MSGDLRTASTKLAHACELLISPSPANLEICSELLDSAVTELDGIAISRSNAEQRRQLTELRNATLRAGALLNSANSFHRGWRSVLGGLMSGYDTAGRPQEPVARGALVLEG
jgi:hypothetical protein